MVDPSLNALPNHGNGVSLHLLRVGLDHTLPLTDNGGGPSITQTIRRCRSAPRFRKTICVNFSPRQAQVSSGRLCRRVNSKRAEK